MRDVKSIRRALPLVLALGLALPVPAALAKNVAGPPADVRAADELAAHPGDGARDKLLQRWADRAAIAEIVFVLRRPASELGAAEGMLLEAALKRAPSSRDALRRRLIARLSQADPERARRLKVAAPSPAPLYPRASVFTTAAVMPDSGDYDEYGRAVLRGVRAGLAAPGTPAGTPLDLRAQPGGGDDATRTLDAFDAVAMETGSIVGELLSVPTLLLATASRFAGLPLLSPTATDENVGRVAPAVFQIGPSGYQRGATLARVALGGDPLRIGILLPTGSEASPFARGFAETVQRLGGQVVWRDTYASGNLNFKDETRDLTTKRVELLFFDGDGREVESLIRQLTRDRLSVRICGGEGLAPERHHTETRVLLEGVQYVGEDWQLPDSLVSRLADAGENPSPQIAGLRARGYLAGHLVWQAVRSGALCPEEITAFLASRRSQEPYLLARGFLDLTSEGARLPVYTVRRSRPVPNP